ncbi:MAG: ComEA family DNA-binding protein [Patescibacteria group bacterium]
MEASQLAEKLSPIIRKYWVPIVFAVLGLILLGYGLIGLFASESSSDVVLEKASEDKTESSVGKIIIDIEGAVISPGVYDLPVNSRIKDIIVRAGGLSQDADRVWFAKNINLAAKLTDGSKLYIPFKGDSPSPVLGTSSSLGTGSVSDLININTASESQLDSLPGVGPATASKIINNRPYQSLEELVSKKALGSKVFENIKDKISI